MKRARAARDRLFAAAPSEFIGTRKALARELRAAGDVDEAAALERTKKPPVGIWALDQVALRDSGTMEALLAASAAAREAQEQLMAGGDPDVLRAAMRTFALRSTDTIASASNFLASIGHRPTAAEGRRMARTLSATTTADDASVALLRAGHLEREIEPAGFAAFGDPAPRRGPRVARPEQSATRVKAREKEKPATAQKTTAPEPSPHRPPALSPAQRKATAAAAREKKRREAAAARQDREAARFARDAERLARQADALAARELDKRAAAREAKARADDARTTASRLRRGRG